MVIERIGPVPAEAGGAWCPVPFPAGAAVVPGPGIRAGISLAAAGDMGLAVRESDPSFVRFLATLGVEAACVRSVRQVHSRVVVHADGQGWPALGAVQLPALGAVQLPALGAVQLPALGAVQLPALGADGIATRDPGLLLTVTVADCLPVFLVDSASGAFAVVHSGWKGTGIVVDALRLMAGRFATRPADVWAAIGPGIGPCCYEVPAERCGEFRARFGGRCVRDGSRLDLREANLALLEKEGIAGVSVADECTACSSRLGSFRRQAAGHPAGPAQFTRMLAFIGRW